MPQPESYYTGDIVRDRQIRESIKAHYRSRGVPEYRLDELVRRWRETKGNRGANQPKTYCWLIQILEV